MQNQINKGTLEERVARIEGTLEQMNERLNHLSDEQVYLKQQIDRMNENLNDRINGLEIRINDRMDKQFKWTLAIVMGSWITLMGTMITLFGIMFHKL